jgi:hypothetical protein
VELQRFQGLERKPATDTATTRDIQLRGSYKRESYDVAIKLANIQPIIILISTLIVELQRFQGLERKPAIDTATTRDI